MPQPEKPGVWLWLLTSITVRLRSLFLRDLVFLRSGPYEADLSQELGRGTFGAVCMGNNIHTNQRVAIKYVKISESTRKFLQREVELLSKCRHRNIIELLCWEDQRDKRFFVLEYCIHGNLNAFMKEREISAGLCRKFLLNIAHAIQYLHNRIISHRDIKPANVLVTEDGSGFFLKLADFGLARYFPASSSGYTASVNTGTHGWMAPEIHDNSGLSTRYNKSADVFSLGLLFLALLRHTFGSYLTVFTVSGSFLGPWMRMQASLGTAVRVPGIGDPSDSRIGLIRRMLAYDSRRRPSMPQVCATLTDLPPQPEHVTRGASAVPAPRPPARRSTTSRHGLLLLLALAPCLLILLLSWPVSRRHEAAEACPDIWANRDVDGLQRALQRDLYGQHLAMDGIVQSVREHTAQRALLLSMHGPQGVGKSHAARIIANHLFGPNSPHVHFIKTSFDHGQRTAPGDLESADIMGWLLGNVSVCPRSMFIIDKSDDMPASLVTDMKELFSTQFKESIFIFEYRYGEDIIRNKVYAHYRGGSKRTDFTLTIQLYLEATHYQNQPWTSWISEHIMRSFLFFLPLEEKHLRKCIDAVLQSEQMVDSLNSLDYFNISKSVFVERVAAKYKLVAAGSSKFSETGCNLVLENVRMGFDTLLYKTNYYQHQRSSNPILPETL